MSRRFLGPFILFLILGLFFLFPFASSWLDKSLSVIKIKNSPAQPWFLENEKSPYALVYFGYVGCTDICVPSFGDIQKVYEKIKENNLHLPFYFVNIDPKQSPDLIKYFAKSYNKDFKGIYSSYKQLKNLEKNFNLQIQNMDVEIFHSSNLYLFKKYKNKYKLDKIYITHPYDINNILKTISNK